LTSYKEIMSVRDSVDLDEVASLIRSLPAKSSTPLPPTTCRPRCFRQPLTSWRYSSSDWQTCPSSRAFPAALRQSRVTRCRRIEHVDLQADQQRSLMGYWSFAPSRDVDRKSQRTVSGIRLKLRRWKGAQPRFKNWGGPSSLPPFLPSLFFLHSYHL